MRQKNIYFLLFPFSVLTLFPGSCMVLFSFYQVKMLFPLLPSRVARRGCHSLGAYSGDCDVPTLKWAQKRILVCCKPLHLQEKPIGLFSLRCNPDPSFLLSKQVPWLLIPGYLGAFSKKTDCTVLTGGWFLFSEYFGFFLSKSLQSICWLSLYLAT